MALLRRDPEQEMEDMLERYARALGQPRAGSQEVIATGDWAPRVNIVETDKAFEIKAEIPEVNKEDVKVTVHNGVLTIQGERKQEKEEKEKSSIESNDYTGASPVALRCLTMSMKLKLALCSRMAC